MAYKYVDQTGTIVSDTSDILDEVRQEWKSALGEDLSTADDTPQGLLIAQETLARSNIIANNAQVANQINPRIAGGVFLDAICAFLGLSRRGATYTLVPGAVLTGVPGTVIPAGVQVATSAGDLFRSLDGVTLDSGGQGQTSFQAVESGPVPCVVGTMTSIQAGSAIIGWETVTNPQLASLGISQQSDASLRNLRNQTLAAQGTDKISAISSALHAVPAITSAKVLENYYTAPMGILVTIQSGVTLAGQVWGLVSEGDDRNRLVIGVDDQIWEVSEQTPPDAPWDPWPTVDYGTTSAITLSGLGTQAGGDWPASLVGGEVILVTHQASPVSNGLYVADSGAWSRYSEFPNGKTILGANRGMSMIKNSVWCCVSGGSEDEIAAAILASKSVGCSMQGGQTATQTGDSGQVYTVYYDRPILVPIAVTVRVSQGTSTNDLSTSVIAAMVDFTTGQVPGQEGWQIGVTASPGDLAGAIVSENPGCRVRDVSISLVSVIDYQCREIAIAQNQQAVLNLSYVQVIIE